MSSLFYEDIENLWGVGTARAKYLRKLGINSIGALIEFYPRTYIDFTKPKLISDAVSYQENCIKAKVISGFSVKKIRDNLTIYRCMVSDGFSNMYVIFFNNKYISKLLNKGKEYFFIGKVEYKNKSIEMIAPVFELFEGKNYLKPVYKQTKGINSRTIEKAVRSALKLLPDKLNDCLPYEIKKKYNLCDLNFMINNMHMPSSNKNLKIAKRRFVFENLLVFYLALETIKISKRQKNKFKILDIYNDEFLKLLDFNLTPSQDKVIRECLKDMAYSEFSMSRLIQGDVGCGKTVVAAALCYSIVKNGMQVAFMAPTEILSNQHYKYFLKLFKGTGIKISLLTSSVKPKERRRILYELKIGITDIIIGTHSLLSDEVEFSNLGFVIADEQHRFGVNQRSKLKCKGESLHLLVMSATPIPRTMALVLHGDLDISTIDELPIGRKEIKTYWIDENKRNRAFDFIKRNIESGRQAYIVCPMIEDAEDSENSSLKSIESYKKILYNSVLKDYKIAIIHGKLNDTQKQDLMLKFALGEINVLLATTVIEVGVDVPNANIILIENAERFGLSALHQLRGRVGRGEFESFCILVSNSKTKEAISRLNIICNTSNGFEISSEDLKLRGPGDIFGTRQHGLIDDIFFNSINDTKIFSEVLMAAKDILSEDPNLIKPQHKQLKYKVSVKLRNMSVD